VFIDVAEEARAPALSREQAIPILFVIDTLRTGGAERHLVRLISGLLRSGRWHPTVYCLQKDGPFVRSLEELGVTVAGPATPWSKTPGRVVASLVSLVRYIRREKPAIVHCYLANAGLLGAVAARLAGAPHVVTTRRLVHDYRGRALILYRLVCTVMDRCSDAVVAVCEAARRQAIDEGTPPDKIVTVHNSITLPELPAERAGRIPGHPVFGTVLRFHLAKGLPYLLEAIPDVVRQLPEARFVIAGDGPERPSVERRIRELGIEEHVELLGMRQDVQALLAQFDVFVLPSLLEGFPNAVLEAMATGLPIVATRVGGVPEMVRHQESGLLVEPGSSTALAAALVEVGCDEGFQRRLGRAARDRAEQCFNPERELRQTEAVYAALLPQASETARPGPD
jgi:glycosyltransferase involved in cell wall biosynthesis